MKQTTKVLLPLGLFMSVVIPITVKSLFTETDFFENSENSKIDYLQPYQAKPEVVSDLPELTVGEDGALEVSSPSTNVSSREQSFSSDSEPRERKLNLPSSLSTGSEPKTIDEAISAPNADNTYK